MLLSPSLRKKLWAACALSAHIGPNCAITPSSQAENLYAQAGFSGPVHTFCGGPSQIDAGLMGLSGQDLVMAFRGTTDQDEDWLNDFRSRLVPLGSCGGRVHQGFLSSVRTLFWSMAAQLPQFLAQNPQHFYITGHSKGGAMAILMAYELNSAFPGLTPSPSVVTFGAPRVGDQQFADCFRLPLIRLESCRDLVPHLPMTAQECSRLKELSLPQTLLSGSESLSQKEIPLAHCLLSSLLKPVCGYASVGSLLAFCPDEKTAPYSASFDRVLRELSAPGGLAKIADWHKQDYDF